MKPIKLSLQQTWELYQTLQSGVGNQQEYLIDEVFEMLERITQEQFLQALWLLYPKIVFSEHSPVEMATMFIAGLKRNDFFMFVDVVEGLKRGNSKR